jgi:hypothetical protein
MRTLVCLFDYFVYFTSMHSYTCIIAPHLGTLAEACEGPDVEPNRRWSRWIYPEDRKTEQVLDGGNACQASFI